MENTLKGKLPEVLEEKSINALNYICYKDKGNEFSLDLKPIQIGRAHV